MRRINQQESDQDWIKAKKIGMTLGILIALSIMVIKAFIEGDFLNSLPLILFFVFLSIFIFKSDLRKTRERLTQRWLDEIRKTKCWN